MMAKKTITALPQYMCLPFGASISCALYQQFSNALKHIAEYKISMTIFVPIRITNYLDDFLFIALCISTCDEAIEQFMILCADVGCPLSEEKTEFAQDWTIFLGVLLDGTRKLLSIPLEKRTKEMSLLHWAIDTRKVTVKFVQKLTGTLNFLNRVIILGRTFTRGMYMYLKPLADVKITPLKQFHHVWLNRQFIQDCRMWDSFLNQADSTQLCCPFIDFSLGGQSSHILPFYSDASLNPVLGMGAIFENRWIVAHWPKGFITTYEPSIEFLELYALVTAIFTWYKLPEFKNG